MANTDYRSVGEYLAKQPRPARLVLQRVLGIIAKAVPKAQSMISYQIAAFKLEGRVLLYVAGWKEHYSLYPATPGVMAAYGKELGSRRVSKGTLRFGLTEPIPTKLIAGIAKERAREVTELVLTKGLRAKKSTTKKAVTKQAVTKQAVTKRAVAKKARAKTVRTKTAAAKKA